MCLEHSSCLNTCALCLCVLSPQAAIVGVVYIGSAAIAQGDDPAAGPDADTGESKDAAEKGVTNETNLSSDYPIKTKRHQANSGQSAANSS